MMVRILKHKDPEKIGKLLPVANIHRRGPPDFPIEELTISILAEDGLYYVGWIHPGHENDLELVTALQLLAEQAEP